MSVNNNELEDKIKELEDWQQNQYNPGYYIGTGRVPLPIKNISKYPYILILAGVAFIVPLILNSYWDIANSTFSFDSSYIISLGLSGAFIYGGIKRLKMRKK